MVKPYLVNPSKLHFRRMGGKWACYSPRAGTNRQKHETPGGFGIGDTPAQAYSNLKKHRREHYREMLASLPGGSCEQDTKVRPATVILAAICAIVIIIRIFN